MVALLLAGLLLRPPLAGAGSKSPTSQGRGNQAGHTSTSQRTDWPGTGWSDWKNQTDSDLHPGRLLWQMLAYVLVILVLGAAAIIVVRKVLPRLRAATGKRISVLETVYLSPRQTVHLLQVGKQRFLVAGTRERISMLAELAGEPGEDIPSDESAGEPGS